MIYIIADDLTGANDTGVQFSKRGYRAVVSIIDRTWSSSAVKDADVLVIDLETRDEDPFTAKKRVRDVVGSLNPKPLDVVYKKVDSTLRGCIGAEIEEIMRLFDMDICVFTPTFSSNQRITVGGYLIVQGEILELSNYFNGNGEPGDASYIPSLLEAQTSLPVGSIELREVAKGPDLILERIQRLRKRGKKIFVCDATSERHLCSIIESGRMFKGAVLYAGSAGLANHLPASKRGKKRAVSEDMGNSGPILLVYATRQPVMKEQIEYLKMKTAVHEIRIDIESIFTEPGSSIDRYSSECIAAFRETDMAVVYTDPLSDTRLEINNRIGEKFNVKNRELEIKIRDFLGEVTRSVVQSGTVKNLFLSGGDTALGVCSALGISSLRILDELYPGIPVSQVDYGSGRLTLVTKAGGFGKTDTLYRILDKFYTMKEKGFSKPDSI